MDLVKGCSPDELRGVDMCAETLGMYTEIRRGLEDTSTNTKTDTKKTDNCQF